MRYIDADFLIEQLQHAKNSVWNKNDHSKSMSEMIEDFCTELKNAPTADVVPKSEVERLQAEVDQLHALLECGVFANSVEDWQKFLNEKRAEDAREIFADFTKHKVCTNEEDFRVLAELKKKYIPKDCRTCKHMLSCEPNVFGICDEYEEKKDD